MRHATMTRVHGHPWSGPEMCCSGPVRPLNDACLRRHRHTYGRCLDRGRCSSQRLPRKAPPSEEVCFPSPGTRTRRVPPVSGTKSAAQMVRLGMTLFWTALLDAIGSPNGSPSVAFAAAPAEDEVACERQPHNAVAVQRVAAVALR